MAQSADTPTGEDIAQQLRDLHAEVATLTAMVADMAADKASAARETAQSVSEQARTRADQYRQEAGRQASETFDAGQDAVRKYPALAVGFALGAGALLGRTVLRRL